jgi:hypothetical protein
MTQASNAWMSAVDIGCALARFASTKEGVPLARNLFAQHIGDTYKVRAYT